VCLLAVEGCAALGKLLEPQDCVAHILPFIVNFSQVHFSESPLSFATCFLCFYIHSIFPIEMLQMWSRLICSLLFYFAWSVNEIKKYPVLKVRELCNPCWFPTMNQLNCYFLSCIVRYRVHAHTIYIILSLPIPLWFHFSSMFQLNFPNKLWC
jgi:hypothetical protein